MKKYFKLMSLALAVGALASCTDELIDTKKLDVKPGDLVATLPSMQNPTRVAVISGGEFVWDNDDQIQVYKLDNLNYSKYTLTSGAGEETGVFSKESGADLSGDDLYAVTQPKPKDPKKPTIYGISATDDGKALLTATIADSYNWETIESNGKDAYKVPTPFWGNATIDGDNINVGFQALTGFIKLDLRALPMGTQAIVVSSHEDFDIQDPANPGQYIQYTGGSNESLSGTMKAELVAGAALAADDRLHHSDTLRVNIDKIVNEDGEDYILYIPIVAQHYDKLYLIAVKQDNRTTYTYDDAEILREFNDITFEISTVIPTLSLTEVLDLNAMGAASFEEASEMIADNYDGQHTLRVKMDPTTFTDNTLYIASNLPGQTSVEIEFTAAPTTLTDIVECEATTLSSGDFKSFNKPRAMTAAKAATLTAEQMAKKRTVRLKFDEDVAADLNILLPTSNIELDSETDQTGKFVLLASTTNHVSGYDQTNYNNKNAAIIIKGGTYDDGTGKMVPVDYAEIEIAENSRGDIYIFEEDTYVQKLTFDDYEFMPNVRITDALVEEINYAYAGGLSTNEEIAIFTTGSAAIGITGITGNHNNKAQVYAYWTGKSLTDNALALGFDSGDIYTAAQLQGVGLGAGLVDGGGDLSTCPSLIATTAPTAVYEYKINDRVNSIWLGGYEFPWIGAQVAMLVGTPVVPGYASNRNIIPEATVTTPVDENTDFFTAVAPQQLGSDIVIDGNEKNLRNMKLSIKDPYFKDPHKCCTTCGDMAVKVEEDLGLIRNIMTTATVTVTNINLNDVLLESEESVDNVASIVGEIGATGDVSIENNNSTNIRIKTVGDNVGGQYGNIFSQGSVEINDVLVGQEVAETGTTDLYVKTTGDNAGGVAGHVNTIADVSTTDAIVHIDEVSAEKGSDVGGIFGDMHFEADSNLEGIEVEVANIFATQAKNNETNLKNTGNNVGGLIGNANGKFGAGKDLDVDDASVTSEKIYAENQNVAGLIGVSNIMTGGDLNIGENTGSKADQPWINVDADLIKAENGYVGGLVGNIATGDYANISTQVGYSDGGKKFLNTIKVNAEKLAGSHAVGGLIGGQFIPTYIGSALHEGAANFIDVTVNDFENTWTADDFKSTAKANYLNITAEDRLKNCGSFGLLDGFKNQALYITTSEKILTGGTCTVANANGVMSEKAVNTGRQVIKNEKKDALYFYLHKDSHSTLPGNVGDQFWGDVNGYVGYDKFDAKYYIDGTQQQGDQLSNVFITYSAAE